MSGDISNEFTDALRRATGRVFCQYCRVSKPTAEIAWMTPRACCTKCKTRGTRRGGRR